MTQMLLSFGFSNHLLDWWQILPWNNFHGCNAWHETWIHRRRWSRDAAIIHGSQVWVPRYWIYTWRWPSPLVLVVDLYGCIVPAAHLVQAWCFALPFSLVGFREVHWASIGLDGRIMTLGCSFSSVKCYRLCWYCLFRPKTAFLTRMRVSRPSWNTKQGVLRLCECFVTGSIYR